MGFKLFGYSYKLHKEGYVYVAVAGLISMFLVMKSGLTGTSVFTIFLTTFIAGFFRDPERISPSKSGVVVSPADGLVTGISIVEPLPDLGMSDMETIRVSVFLSVFDVHITRMPIAGNVVTTKYHKGKFLSANLDKASEDNERNSIVIESESGKRIGCVQIAGMVARRIVSDAEVGSFFATGERYGIIKFGSRVDIYLPTSSDVKVSIGQRMIGGETVIAKMD
jgi:phosphatidylserine decarboxylase